MPEARRYQVIAAIADRLREIKIANGFNTDAGEAVNVGFAPALGDDDSEIAIAILIDDDDAPNFEQEQVFYNLPVEIQALASSARDREMPWMVIEQLLQDIKRAMELEDRTLGKLLSHWMTRGVTRTLPREAGSHTRGLAITYRFPIAEKWGNP